MTSMETTDMIAMATRFVNGTSDHIFLTGKAGTGKTTFLHKLAENTHKKFVVVAPTGIAALNAKGVTIHSQFLLPLGTFLPDRNPSGDFSNDQSVYTQHTLSRRHPLNSIRRQVLRDIDLLVIDEVSMLRADVLDAIDYRMRSVKRNYHQSFGGVQVLMIGDLYQLPPVVKDHEMNYLRRYYNSPHFFEAKALQADGFVYLELDKIFRQQDASFIRILNNLRNNVSTAEDIRELNAHYKTNEEIQKEEDVVTLTTHNYKADELNRQSLTQLPGKTHSYRAEVENDFPEFLYPVAESIELKIGAQIMFVKNDSVNGVYYNGKLARVIGFPGDDKVLVEMAGSKEEYILKKETWENKKYTVNATTRELDEEVVGRFTQYPIKLAWAITVHKSQGLTFDKAIIDVGNAFAAGQVYVALSRLRSLDGLILRTRIDPGVIATDEQIVKFAQQKELQGELTSMLNQRQNNYLRTQLNSVFDFDPVLKEIEKVQKEDTGEMQFEDESMRTALQLIAAELMKERGNTAAFRKQLLTILGTGEQASVLERISKGSVYYLAFMKEQTKRLLIHIEEVRRYSRTKKYLNALEEIDALITKKTEDIGKLSYLATQILTGAEIVRQEDNLSERREDRKKILREVEELVAHLPKLAHTKSGRTRKSGTGGKPKAEKGSSNRETYALLNSGLTVKQIAEQRKLSPVTIEGHVVQGILEGSVQIHKVLSDAEIAEIQEAHSANPGGNSSDIFNYLKSKYSYNQIRMVQNHRTFVKSEGAADKG